MYADRREKPQPRKGSAFGLSKGFRSHPEKVVISCWSFKNLFRTLRLLVSKSASGRIRRAEDRQTASLLYEREELRVYMSAGARAAGTLAQRAAGERAARRTACLVVPATLCALVGVLQQRQHERHTA